MMQQENFSPFIALIAAIITAIVLVSVLVLFQSVYQHINHVAILEMKANRYY